MSSRIPNPSGRKIDREYDLDDPRTRKSLGLRDDRPRADKIIHDITCDHTIIEYKGRAQPLKHAIDQLASTIDQVNLPNIKYVIAVKEKIPKGEKGIYRWDHNTHKVYLRVSKEKLIIVAHGLPLLLYRPEEAYWRV